LLSNAVWTELKYLLILPRGVADLLRAIRQPGESFSDVILVSGGLFELDEGAAEWVESRGAGEWVFVDESAQGFDCGGEFGVIKFDCRYG
jgi:hypothetical protein